MILLPSMFYTTAMLSSQIYLVLSSLFFILFGYSTCFYFRTTWVLMNLQSWHHIDPAGTSTLLQSCPIITLPWFCKCKSNNKDTGNSLIIGILFKIVYFTYDPNMCSVNAGSWNDHVMRNLMLVVCHLAPIPVSAYVLQTLFIYLTQCSTSYVWSMKSKTKACVPKQKGSGQCLSYHSCFCKPGEQQL